MTFAFTLALAFLALFFTFFAMLFRFAFTVFAPDLTLALAALTKGSFDLILNASKSYFYK